MKYNIVKKLMFITVAMVMMVTAFSGCANQPKPVEPSVEKETETNVEADGTEMETESTTADLNDVTEEETKEEKIEDTTMEGDASSEENTTSKKEDGTTTTSTTESVTNSTTVGTTVGTTQSSTERPTQNTTQGTTQAPTQKPSEQTTVAPTEAPKKERYSALTTDEKKYAAWNYDLSSENPAKEFIAYSRFGELCNVNTPLYPSVVTNERANFIKQDIKDRQEFSGLGPITYEEVSEAFFYDTGKNIYKKMGVGFTNAEGNGFGEKYQLVATYKSATNSYTLNSSNVPGGADGWSYDFETYRFSKGNTSFELNYVLIGCPAPYTVYLYRDHECGVYRKTGNPISFAVCEELSDYRAGLAHAKMYVNTHNDVEGGYLIPHDNELCIDGEWYGRTWVWNEYGDSKNFKLLYYEEGYRGSTELQQAGYYMDTECTIKVEF